MADLRRRIQNRIEQSFLTVPAFYALEAYYLIRSGLYGHGTASPEDVRNVEENVTFVYKSFNRQKKAKRLYHSIRSYFPGAKVVIADDSAVPLEIPGAEVVHLPFNSGLSRGLIAAIEKVETPYMMRLDDDMLLLPQSHIPELLQFLQKHEEVDLVAVMASAPPEKSVGRYLRFDMGKPMIIPVGTEIDGRIVSAKVPNCFLARTDSIRKVGYDPHIQRIDHHEFFFRAAGRIVSALDPHSFLLHCHNPFDRNYLKYRRDYRGDLEYIYKKHAGEGYR